MKLTRVPVLANMCGMSPVIAIVLKLVFVNLFHGIAALLWIAGARRFMRPFSPLVLFDLFRWALVLPPVLIILDLLKVLPGGPRLIRAELWARQFMTAGPLLRWLIAGLLIGTTFIFVFQELIPIIQILGRKSQISAEPGPRLRAGLERAKAAYQRAGILNSRMDRLRVRSLPTQDHLAALHGLLEPVLVISDGLIGVLDDQELETVIAHELAHLYLGGNIRMFWIWIARGMQAFNPVSLILFRELTEAREAACDALAAQVTGKSRILATALLKFTESLQNPGNLESKDLDPIVRAGLELRRRAEMQSTAARHEALIGFLNDIRLKIWSPSLQWLTALALGGMLWIVA